MAKLRKRNNLKKIVKDGKAIILAYDQGLEHGPTSDFNDKNVDPLYIIDIAKRAKVTALTFGKGISEKYNKEIRESKIPLIVKLSGKTKLPKGEPISEQIGTVEEAIRLGAVGVGYTIHIGSEHEDEMVESFSKIQKEAHEKGLVVMLWVYPRGKAIKDEFSRDILSYSARVGLELGADIVKIKHNGKLSDLKWSVKSAGRTNLVISGGPKESKKDFLADIKNVVKARGAGIAVGRNVWQAENPIEVINDIKNIFWPK